MEPYPRSTDYGSLARADKLILVDGALKALAENPDIRAAMEPRGYDARGRAEGQALADAVRDSTRDQGGTRTTRLRQTATQDRGVEAAETLYRPLAATAHVVFEGQPEVLTALGLSGEHSNARAARLARMRAFATEAAAPAQIEAFTRVGIPKEAFADLLAAVEAATDDVEDQDADAAVSQDATAERVGDFDALDAWVKTMHGHARIVLAGRPQLLEALGIRPR